MTIADWMVAAFTAQQAITSAMYIYKGDGPQGLLWAGVVVMNSAILWSRYNALH